MKNEKTMCRAADPSDAVGRQDLREVRNQKASGNR